MKNIWRIALSLTVVCKLKSFCFSGSKLLRKKEIERRSEEGTEKALQRIALLLKSSKSGKLCLKHKILSKTFPF